MKKIILAILLICLFFSFGGALCASAEDERFVKVIYTSIYVYSSAEAKPENVCLEVDYGTKLKLKDQNQITGTDQFLYYLVEISVNQQQTSGYVLCSQVLSTNISSPIRDLDSNASLGQDADVYVLRNSSYEKTGESLTAKTKIKILDGYNENQKYTRIQYKDQEGDIITAYVLTSTISVSGISRTMIGAIIIIISTVSLVLLLFGVKGKKKKN